MGDPEEGAKRDAKIDIKKTQPFKSVTFSNVEMIRFYNTDFSDGGNDAFLEVYFSVGAKSSKRPSKTAKNDTTPTPSCLRRARFKAREIGPVGRDLL